MPEPPNPNLARSVGALIVSEEYEPAPRFGPLRSPVDRFAHLPEETRRWLEQLRPQDIIEIDAAVQYLRSAKTIGRFGRWMLITIFVSFTSAVTFGEKYQAFWKWLTGAGAPK